MKQSYEIYQVDAFTSELFSGNPAAVVPLDEWLPDELLQKIALENNLSETAFFIKDGEGYRLRWFTPAREVDLCGHATLATAYVLFRELGHPRDEIRFTTERSGELIVKEDSGSFVMDFPAIPSHPADEDVRKALPPDLEPLEVLTSNQDLMVVLKSEADVSGFDPGNNELRFAGHRGMGLTARGDRVDFVSRFFYPELRIEEDPVTGSAHCQLAPYWAKTLGKNRLMARQVSARGGEIKCEVKGDRVILTGDAVLYLTGEIRIP